MIYNQPLTKAQSEFEKTSKFQVAKAVTVRIVDQPMTFAQFSFENKSKPAVKVAPQPAAKIIAQPAKTNTNLPAEVKKFINTKPRFKKTSDFETLEDMGAGFATGNGFHFYNTKVK